MARFTYGHYYALRDYLTDKVEDALANLEDDNNVQVLYHEFPNYNPDWCKEDFDVDDEEIRDDMVDKIVDYLMRNLFYYYDEDSNE